MISKGNTEKSLSYLRPLDALGHDEVFGLVGAGESH